MLLTQKRSWLFNLPLQLNEKWETLLPILKWEVNEIAKADISSVPLSSDYSAVTCRLHSCAFPLSKPCLSAGVQWELPLQESLPLLSSSQGPRALGQCATGKQPLQKTPDWPGTNWQDTPSLACPNWICRTWHHSFVHALPACRLSRLLCQRPRTPRKCLSLWRPSWLQIFPMNSLNCWRK